MTARREVPSTRTVRRRDRSEEAVDPTDLDVEVEVEDDEDEDGDINAAAPTKRPERRTRRDERDEEGDDDDDEDEDEDDAPRPRKATKARLTANPLPPGVFVGTKGAEAILNASSSGPARLTLKPEPELIKFLQDEPFANYRQHWASVGGQGNRPYTCSGRDAECPLCGIGDNASATFAYNILHLSGGGEPEVKVLQLGIKAYKSLVDLSTKGGEASPSKDYWAINRSGKNQQSQTNFRPVKERDLEEDWEEILDFFSLDDLDDIIANAENHLYDVSIVSVSTKKELRDISRIMAEDDEA